MPSANFDSCAEMLAVIKAKPNQWLKSEPGDWSDTDDHKSGERAGDCLIRKMREGDPRNAAHVESIESKLSDLPIPQTIRRATVWTDQGDAVDMQRVYSGNLDSAWRRTVRAKRNGVSRVRIIIDSMAHGGIDRDTMAWRGVAALKLCDILTTAGYSVRLDSAFTATGQGGSYDMSVCVKSYESPSDITSLAATAVSPGFFRILGHAWGEAVGNGKGDGYRCGYLDSDSYIVASARRDDAQSLVMLCPNHLHSANDASDWIRDQIRAMNGGDDDANP